MANDHTAQSLLTKLASLPAGEFCIVNSGSLGIQTIAIAQACGEWFVDESAFGFAIVRRAATQEPSALRAELVQRGVLGDGTPWMGTMQECLADAREAATVEAAERRRLAEQLAALRAEIERLLELADSEGTRAVNYLRHDRKAEKLLREVLEVLGPWGPNCLGMDLYRRVGAALVSPPPALAGEKEGT